MSRYTLKEFEEAGLKPNEGCDGLPFPGPSGTDESYWHPCQYHQGYIDGYIDGFEVGKIMATDEIFKYQYLKKMNNEITQRGEELPWALKDWSYEAGDPEITQQ